MFESGYCWFCFRQRGQREPSPLHIKSRVIRIWSVLRLNSTQRECKSSFWLFKCRFYDEKQNLLCQHAQRHKLSPKNTGAGVILRPPAYVHYDSSTKLLQIIYNAHVIMNTVTKANWELERVSWWPNLTIRYITKA